MSIHSPAVAMARDAYIAGFRAGEQAAFRAAPWWHTASLLMAIACGFGSIYFGMELGVATHALKACTEAAK